MEKDNREKPKIIRKEELTNGSIKLSGATLAKNIPNQDAFFICPYGAGVFDGVSSSNNPHLASARASEYLKGILSKLQGQPISKEGMIKYFKNTDLFLKEFSPGGLTTGSVIYLQEKDKKGIVVHAGDSGVYLLRDGLLRKITKDDRINPESNIITKALGELSEIKPQIYEFDIKNGDMFLICSDGISDNLPLERIQEIMISKSRIEEINSKLIEEASQGRKKDDITAVIIKFDLGFFENIKDKLRRKIYPTKSLIPTEFLEKSIKESRTLEELKQAILKNGENTMIIGNNKIYTPEELVDLIDKAYKGEIDIKKITRTLGIREKLMKLIKNKN